MSFPLPPDSPAGLDNIAPWLDYLSEKNSYRYQDGYSGFWFTFLLGLIGDTTEQLLFDVQMLPHVDQPESPEDVVKFIAKENGIVRYSGESDEAYRERVARFWETVPYYGTEKSIVDFINLAGYGEPKIITFLLGSSSDIAPYKGGLPIPAYPHSRDHYSQFSVSIRLEESIGSGNESDLMSDAQLATVRNMIRVAKPVDWVCREIILFKGESSVYFYDDGHSYDGSISYQDENNLHSSFAYERHKGQT